MKKTGQEVMIEGIVIGFDPASPDGDKARLVLRHPDGTLELYVSESQVAAARGEAYANGVMDGKSIVAGKLRKLVAETRATLTHPGYLQDNE